MSVGFSAAEVLLTAIFREQIGLVYTDDAAVIAIASQFLIFASGFQFFDSISAPVQGILRGYKDAKVPFILLLAAYWGACFPGLVLMWVWRHRRYLWLSVFLLWKAGLWKIRQLYPFAEGCLWNRLMTMEFIE